MVRRRLGTARLACFLGASALWPQARPVLQLAVRVVNAQTEPDRPLPGVHVALMRSRPIPVAESKGVADRNGLVVFEITPELKASLDVYLEVSGAPGLVVYKPPEGDLDLSRMPGKREVHLRLLPKGSPALLEPARLEAFISRLQRSSPSLSPVQSGCAATEAGPDSVAQRVG
jgi:hypothetical protein